MDVATPPAPTTTSNMMDVTVNTQVLARELRLLDKIVSAKATIPMLTNILFRTDGDQLHMSATDMEVALTTQCASWVQGQGAATLPSKKILSVIDQLPNDDVQMKFDGKIVLLTCGKFKSRLQTLPAADFPPMPAMEGNVLTIPFPQFQTMIERVHYAVSDKGEKRELTGALMTMLENSVALVATDGKRLSLATTSGVTGEPVSALLPNKTLDMLTSLEHTGDMDLSNTDKHLFFKLGDRLLISRTIDGRFPAYERVIPRSNEHIVVVGRVALAAAIRRVGLLSDDESSAVNLTFTENQVLVNSRSHQIGDADEEVPTAYTGADIALAVNWKYVLNFLDAAAGQTIEIRLKDSTTALLLTDGTDYLNVVMTIKK